MSLFFRIFQHLLPDADAWRIRRHTTSWTWGDGSNWGDPGLLWGGTAAGRTIDRFFAGLANFWATVRTFVDLVYLDLFPDSTRELALWEHQFGLSTATLEADRRLNIEAAWQARGGQSPRYLQDVVQAAGFDVYIHEWWSSGPPYVARDPRNYTTDPLVGTVQCGEALALCGEADALCNNFLANDPGYIVNDNLLPIAPPVVPSDPAYWPYFLYWSSPDINVKGQVPAERRQEFRALILKLCPAQQWLVTYVDYV